MIGELSKKEKIWVKIYILLLIFGFWSIISMFIQAYKCPFLSDFELLKSVPKAMIGNFKKC